MQEKIKSSIFSVVVFLTVFLTVFWTLKMFTHLSKPDPDRRIYMCSTGKDIDTTLFCCTEIDNKITGQTLNQLSKFRPNEGSILTTYFFVIQDKNEKPLKCGVIQTEKDLQIGRY